MSRRKKFPDGTKFSGESAFVPVPNSLGGGFKTIKMDNPDMYEDYLSDRLETIVDEDVTDDNPNSKSDNKIKDELSFDIDYNSILSDTPDKSRFNALKYLFLDEDTKKGAKNHPKSIHQGHRQRLYSRYQRYGLDALEEHEVLELLLFFVYQRKDTNPIAHALIEEFGSLDNVLKADFSDLICVEGIGNKSALLINFCNQLCTYLGSHTSYNIPLDNVSAMSDFCCDYFRQRTKENFIVLILDTKKNLKHIVPISEGTENETAYYPRNVVKAAIKHKANLVAIAHNHTGNSVEPSDNDIFITNKISKLLSSMGIPLVDHIICCGKNFTSFSDRRLLPE